MGEITQNLESPGRQKSQELSPTDAELCVCRPCSSYTGAQSGPKITPSSLYLELELTLRAVELGRGKPIPWIKGKARYPEPTVP